jgi:hypothetical protein
MRRPAERQCSDVDGRVETAAFGLAFAAEWVAASDLGRPGFRAKRVSPRGIAKHRAETEAGLEFGVRL